MKRSSAPAVFLRALSLSLLFLFFVADGASAIHTLPESPVPPTFEFLRLALNAKPPAACVVSLYGTMASRVPDGALCLCHAGVGGKPGYWEQIGTGQRCWPEKK